MKQEKDDELEALEQRRANFMADDTPVDITDAYALLEIANKLREEDTSLNIYELYKHPEARAKLFVQVTEACYVVLQENAELTRQPTESDKRNFCNYLEEQYEKIVRKQIVSTDQKALKELMDVLELPKELESQFIRDVVISGLLSLVMSILI